MQWQLTTAAVRRVEVDSGILPEKVKGGTTNGDVEEVRSLLVEDTRIGEGGYEQDCAAEGEGANEITEHNSRRLHANLHVILAILTGIDGI
jgi:hypothetical protein